jgi:arylsulfatase/arylsulfatase A
MRAMDQGFDESLVLRGGGLAQPSEPRENNRRYTDPILFHNGQQVQTKGYCTDVYFDAALKFIDQANKDERNFFVYLPTNAPHGPFHDVPEPLRQHYMQKDLASLLVRQPKKNRLESEVDKLARIAAMITNVDQNVGRLLERLDQRGLTENTIVFFLVDNGPNSLRYVGNRRGMKSHVHEGGIRSPLWVQWPAQLKVGQSVKEIAAHIDLMPTILDACGVQSPQGVKLDGRSLLPLLQGQSVQWPSRSIVIQSHRGDQPFRYHHFMIRDDRWKLLHASGFGRESFPGQPNFELYDVRNDPKESTNLITNHPEVFQRLKAEYDRWFDDVSSTRPDNYAPPRIHVGTPHESPTVLTRQDWRGGTWARDSAGHWEIHVAKAGRYDVRLEFDANPNSEKAKLSIGDVDREVAVKGGAKSIEIRNVELPAGDSQLRAVLSRDDKSRGVYQVFVTRR